MKLRKAVLLPAVFALIRFADVAAAAEAPALEPLQSESSVNDALYAEEKIGIDRLEVRELTLDGAERFLVVDPSIVTASQPNENSLVIKGLSYGQTYIHVWTRQGRRTLQVEVLPAFMRKAAKTEKKASDLKVIHSLSSNVNGRYDELTDRNTKSQSLQYQFSMNGQTKFGYNRTAFNYYSLDEKKRISQASTEFRNGAGEMKAGDVNQSFSQILTMPVGGFQGAQWASPKDKVVNVELLGGYTNRQFWGETMGAEFKAPEHPFVGSKLGVRPAEGLEVFVAGLKALNDLYPERSENKTFGSRLDLGGISLRVETSQGSLGSALYGDLQVQKRHGYFIASQRNVGENYMTVNGGSWYRGERGQMMQFGLKDLGFLSLADINYNQYRASYLNNPSEPDALNRELRGRFMLKAGGARLDQELNFEDDPGIMLASRKELTKTRLSYRFRYAQPHVAFRRQVRHFYENSERDFVETGAGYGLEINPLKALSARFSGETVRAKVFSSGLEETFINMSAGFLLQGSLGLKAFRESLLVEYRDINEINSGRSRYFSSQLRADFDAGKNLQLFVIGQVDYDLSAQTRGHFMGVNTGIQWATGLNPLGFGSRKVEGYVFKDLNGDGVRQKNEPGIPGVKLVLNDKKERITDAEGRFQFPSTRGQLSVSLNRETLPPNMRLSSSNPQVFSESDESKVRAYFGVAYLGEIRGAVLIDANENGLADEEDKPMWKARVGLSAGSESSTDLNGRFTLGSVAPGQHRVSLNVLSLPANMISATPSAVKLEMNEGEKKEVMFLVRPARMVSGTAFWDKNKNGAQDPDEPAVGGIKLFTEVSEAETDEEGRYFLNKFNAGKASIHVSTPSLGREWKLGRALPVEFEVFSDQPLIQTLDIPLYKIKD